MNNIFPVSGYSMRFLLEPGDTVVTEQCAPESLRPGDIALLVNWQHGLPANYIIHRVIINFSLGGKRLLLTKGDSILMPDLPLSAFQAVGRVSAILKGNTLYNTGSACWFLKAAYSLCVSCMISFAVFTAATLFSLACRAAPAALTCLLNSLYRVWEAWYPALLRLLSMPVSATLAARSAADQAVQNIKSGRICSDETWQGRVTIMDSLIGARGAAITVLPGTEIVFDKRVSRAFPVLRRDESGSLRKIDSSILVYGEVRAAGTADLPVIFTGKDFFGVYAMGSGKVALDFFRMEGAKTCAAGAGDRAQLQAENGLFSECAQGVELSGVATGSVSNCLFSGAGNPALLAMDNSSLLVSASKADGCRGMAVEAVNSACVGLSGFSGNGCACGIYASGSPRLSFKDCRLLNNSGHGAELRGSAELKADNCVVENNSAGLLARGRNRLRFTKCRFTNNGGPAVELSGNNMLNADNCSFNANASGVECFFENRRFFNVFPSGTGGGLFLRNCDFAGNHGHAIDLRGPGALEADNCAVENNSAGLRAYGRGRQRLTRCVFKNNSGSGIELSGNNILKAAGCAFQENAAGVESRGLNTLEITCASFLDNRGPSLELAGNCGARVSDTVSAGNPAALVLGGSSRLDIVSSSARSGGFPALAMSGGAMASAAGSRFYSRTDAVFAAERCRLEMRSSLAVSAEGAGLNLTLLRAELRDVKAEGAVGLRINAARGAIISGLSIKARDYALISWSKKMEICGLRTVGGFKGGVCLRRGKNSIEEAAIDATLAPGLAVDKGGSLRFKRVFYDHQPWSLPAASFSLAVFIRRFLFHFAVSTYTLHGFSAVYRWIYLLGPRAARRLLFIRGVTALYLYRGMTKGGWIPTLSDMDLVAVVEPLPPSEDWRFYGSFSLRRRLLKKLLPFTGEVIVADESDFRSFVSSWGVKGREFSESSRLLCGRRRISGQPESSEVEVLADVAEAFYAYTLLTRHFFTPSLPAAFARRSCLKSFIDVKRYLDAASPLRASRGRYAEAAGFPLENFMQFEEGKAVFGAFQALHAAALERLAEMPLEPFTPQFSHGEAELSPRRAAFDAACSAIESSAGVKIGFALDALYRLYAVLPGEAAANAELFERVVSAFRRERENAAFLGHTPILLSPPAFELLSFTSYLNNPLFWLDLSAQPAAAETALGDGGFYCYNLKPAARRPAQDLLRRTALLALTHFGATWRGMWGEMPPHYFYSRAAGLRLLLDRSVPSAFSGVNALSEAFREAYGRELPAWEEYREQGHGRKNYEFVAAQAAAAAGKNASN